MNYLNIQAHRVTDSFISGNVGLTEPEYIQELWLNKKLTTYTSIQLKPDFVNYQKIIYSHQLNTTI